MLLTRASAVLSTAALLASVGALSPGCKKAFDPAGWPCEHGELCLAGYACNPVRSVCVPAIDIDCQGDGYCPSAIADGDPCPAAGVFLPCADDAESCDLGCRTCDDDLHWGPCEVVSRCETVNDCLELSEWPVCFSTKCEANHCVFRPLPEVACEEAFCFAGVLYQERLCGSDGSCPETGVQNCPGMQCSPDATDCLAECLSDGDCLAGNYCHSDGTCMPLLPLGADCVFEGAHACTSMTCSHGVCCAQACDGPCTECNSAGQCGNVPQGELRPGCNEWPNGCLGPGSCDGNGGCAATPLTAGQKGECPACQICDGAGACANMAAGSTDTGCDAPAGTCSDADSCDGNGACDFRHTPNGGEGPCPVCQDCNGNGACANVPDNQPDVGCDTAAAGCSGADYCLSGGCYPNDLPAGSDDFCPVCQDCDGGGSCTNVTAHVTDQGCSAGASCSGTGLCLVYDGGPCTAAEDCWSNLCSTNVCGPPAETGNPCASAAECSASYTCAGGVCLKNDGQVCSADEQCVHACVDGVCDRRATYRSVGPNRTTALASGSVTSTMTIAGSLASFAAPLPGNIGVGDAIEYDYDNRGTRAKLAFVHRRDSATSLLVKDELGAAPTATSQADDIWVIRRAYTSLANAEDGVQNSGITLPFDSFTGGLDLASRATIWGIACYNDAADTTAVDFDGWSTSSQYYLWVFTPYLPHHVGASQRHAGKWTTTGYRLEVSNTPAVEVFVAALHIEGLQIWTTQNTFNDTTLWVRNVGVTGADIRIGHNILRGSGNTKVDWHDGVEIFMAGTGTARIWDNIVYDYTGTATQAHAISLYAAGWTSYVYSNTIASSRFGITVGNGSAILKNNLVQNCDDGYHVVAPGSMQSDFNVSDVAGDATNATFTQGHATAVFVNEAAADYHLGGADTAATGNGIDLTTDASLSFGDDVDMQRRGAAWDIGADQH